MSNSKSDLKMVVRRLWNLPGQFFSEALDSQILESFSSAFEDLLIRANLSDNAWDNRIDSFRKHRLLDLAIPQEATFAPIEIVVPKKDGTVEKIVHPMDKPLAYGFDMQKIAIDRSRIDEPSYLRETALVLAYMLLYKLWRNGDTELLFGQSEGRVVLLSNLSGRTLGEFLDKFHLGQSNAPTLASFLISRSMECKVEELDAFSGFDRLAERLAAQFEVSHRELSARLDLELDRKVRQAKEELGLEDNCTRSSS